jgi:HNH endonuclease
MPYKDPEKARVSAQERSRRYRTKEHAKRFGEGAGDMRGRHGNHARGPANFRWNNGRILSTEGYIKVRVGRDHPLADPNGYAYEHLLVWVAAGLPPPAQNELLHHKDENKKNNRLDNLELKTRSAHGEHHISTRRRDANGRLLARSSERNALPEVSR